MIKNIINNVIMTSSAFLLAFLIIRCINNNEVFKIESYFDYSNYINNNVVINDTKEEKPIEVLNGSLSGYGPDCYGCYGNLTASGMYVGNGNIYYDDKDYGKVRIVAGDSSYPFGTIIKVINYYQDDFYAVVLDRGGDIGKNRRYLFDLLFPSEHDASISGSKRNVTFEIIRLGY